ncbi:MAG: class A beta-lactamase-related serine hydrolase [Actinobacteria bacterium ATB1]|nr:class A beta-lactamase-related serine hydrolase [Actinobacteria bacterium ATB1]
MDIGGRTDPAFARVRDAFAHCFSELGEVGAACCVLVDGRPVVDLWGGYVDRQRTRPWEDNTLVGFYSVGKPLVALTLLQLVASGRVDLDAPVCRWWPEFAAEGKQDVTVRQVLCHRAGLPAVRRRLPEGAMLDWDLMTSALAAQDPWWEPGTKHVYHTNTYGFLVGEIVRRVTGDMPGTRLQREVARPVGADVHFGVRDADLGRCAEVLFQPTGDAPDRAWLDRPMSEEERMVVHGYANPSGLSSLGVMNTRAWRQAQIPSTNGHGTARGVARIYSALAGNPSDSHSDASLLDPAILCEATAPQSEGWCPVLKREVTFGLGFQLTRPDRPLGPNPGTFGHYGTGGSLGFADPGAGVGFGYVMNHVIPRWQNPRNRELVRAVYDCL